MLLENKVVLVTGASRGIGASIAIEASRNGASVVVHYGHSRIQAEEVQNRIADLGGRAILVQADLGDAEAPLRLVEESWGAFGSIDVLISNAGITGLRSHFLDIPLSDFEQTWNVNVRGAFLTTQGIAKKMVSEGKGRILVVTSVDAIRPATDRAHYAATKGALESMMKNVALELSPHGILVNTLAIGAVETDMTAATLADPDALNEVLRGIPLSRMAKPSEIAKLVCILASSQVTYMTGSTILVDGGLALMRGYGSPTNYMQG